MSDRWEQGTVMAPPEVGLSQQEDFRIFGKPQPAFADNSVVPRIDRAIHEHG